MIDMLIAEAREKTVGDIRFEARWQRAKLARVVDPILHTFAERHDLDLLRSYSCPDCNLVHFETVDRNTGEILKMHSELVGGDHKCDRHGANEPRVHYGICPVCGVRDDIIPEEDCCEECWLNSK